MQNATDVTIIFPVYQAEGLVDDLMHSLFHQNCRSEFHVIFIDNASKDSTTDKISSFIRQNEGMFKSIRLIQNPKNLGLAKSLNVALNHVKTEFALTCHSDCTFEDPNYVVDMLSLIQSDEKVAALTGQPVFQNRSSHQVLSFLEKTNLAVNLQDCFPESDDELIEIGFAEGRCDLFRMKALKEVGFYKTDLRLAGEDQILAGDLREAGYLIKKAQFKRYFLKLSPQQNTFFKLHIHQYRYGMAHPYILLRSKKTKSGFAGKNAGKNRNQRSTLRLLQLFSCFFFFLLCVEPLFFFLWIAVLVTKYVLFQSRMNFLKLNSWERSLLFFNQVTFDFFYGSGFFIGVLKEGTSRFSVPKNIQT